MQPLLGTSLIFLIVFFLSFFKIDISIIGSVLAALHYGFIPGMLVGLGGKNLSRFFLKRFRVRPRTFIHLFGLIIAVNITTFIPWKNSLFVPMIMFFVYTAITFPIIQLFDGNLFRGITSFIKDSLISIMMLLLLSKIPF